MFQVRQVQKCDVVMIELCYNFSVSLLPHYVSITVHLIANYFFAYNKKAENVMLKFPV